MKKQQKSKEKTVFLGVRISESDMDFLTFLAANEKRSLSSLIRWMIGQWPKLEK